MSPERHGWGRSALRFGRAFVREPAMLGSVVPSSRYLVRRVLRRVEWERAHVVVEFGPGVGTLTAEILRRMPRDGRLLTFETHAGFVEELRRALPDPRLEVVHGSAETLREEMEERGLDGADYILSGIPFTLIPEASRQRILVDSREALRPGGAMLVYQFSPTIGPPLERVFDRVDRGFEPRNFLPAVFFECRADEAPGAGHADGTAS